MNFSKGLQYFVTVVLKSSKIYFVKAILHILTYSGKLIVSEDVIMIVREDEIKIGEK